MKKRLLILACMLICLFSLSGCGKKEEEKISLTSDEKASYEKQLTNMINDVSALSKSDAEDVLKKLSAKSVKYKLVNGWIASVDDLGKLKSIGEYKYEADRKELKIKVDVEYEKRTATYIFFLKKEFVKDYDAEYLMPNDINIVVKRSIKENLINAAYNTLMGMGTVFVVLIIIIVVISLFKYVNMLDKWLADRKAAKEEAKMMRTEAVNNVVEQIAQKEDQTEELVDDSELVAVISAAIAAYEADSEIAVEGFRVRSIRRATKRNW